MHIYIHSYTVIARVQCHNYTRGRECTLGNNKSACNYLYIIIGVEVDMDGLKPGSIVGIVLGVIFFLILCIGGILLLIGTRKIICHWLSCFYYYIIFLQRHTLHAEVICLNV